MTSLRRSRVDGGADTLNVTSLRRSRVDGGADGGRHPLATSAAPGSRLGVLGLLAVHQLLPPPTDRRHIRHGYLLAANHREGRYSSGRAFKHDDISGYHIKIESRYSTILHMYSYYVDLYTYHVGFIICI